LKLQLSKNTLKCTILKRSWIEGIACNRTLVRHESTCVIIEFDDDDMPLM
jgi:hypothetical protein